MTKKLKSYSEFKTFMEKGANLIIAIFGEKADLEMLADSLYSVNCFKKHPRRAYRMYVDEFNSKAGKK